MLVLRVHDLQWVKGPEDDPTDQCAHGTVEFSIDGVEFVRPTSGLWTVSAAGLFLLRTIELDHTFEEPVTDGAAQLFPCCGFNVYPSELSRFGFVCHGCPTGIDVEVKHIAGSVHLTSEREQHASVPKTQWSEAVKCFGFEVESLYRDSATKETIEEPELRAGWKMFWREWSDRLGTT